MSARAKSLNGKQDLSNTDIEYPGLYVRLGDMRMRSHTRRDFMKTAIAATIAAGLHNRCWLARQLRAGSG